MHQILIYVDDADFERLQLAKSGTWRELLLSAAETKGAKK